MAAQPHGSDIMKKKGGFTLAELLIIIVIISILVGIAIPILNARLEQAKQTADIANIRSAYGCATAECLFNCSDGLYYFTSGELVRQRPSQKYGQSSKEFESFYKDYSFPIFGIPESNYISIYIMNRQIAWMQWGSYPVITNSSQYLNTTQAQRLKLDLSLTHALQRTIQNMSYREILNMFGGATVGQNDSNGKKIEKWTGTCYTIANSYVNKDGEINQQRNDIFARELFSRIGYDLLDNPAQTYLITSWNYGSSATYQDDLKIKIDIGIDLSRLNESELDNKATTAFIYLNGNGLPRDDELFGHNRENK